MPSYRLVVDTRFTAGSGGGTNTWHIRTGLDALPDDDISPIAEWIEQFYTGVRTFFPSTMSWSWDGTVTEILTAEPQFLPAVAGWTVLGGASVGSYGPSAGMACVTWRTELNTRSGRGRTFLGPLAASSIQADGTLSESALTGIRGAASALVGQSNTNENVGAVGVFSPTDNVIRDVVSSTVTDQVAILRSRRG